MREEPDPDDPEKTKGRRAARAGRRRARRGRRPHRRPGAGHHQRRLSPRTPTPISPTSRSSSTPRPTKRSRRSTSHGSCRTSTRAGGYPNGAVAGNLLGFVGHRRRRRSPASSFARTRASPARTARSATCTASRTGCRIPGSEVVHKQAHDGGTLQLTIDADLQLFVQRIAEEQRQAVGADWATVDGHGGEDGRAPRRRRCADRRPQRSRRDGRGRPRVAVVHRPVRARARRSRPSTAASVINAGKADPLSQITADYRYLPPNGANINDSFFHGPTAYTLTGRAHRLLEHRHVAVRRAADRPGSATTTCSKFGLGEQTEVGFPGEEPGDLHGGSARTGTTRPSTRTMFGQGLTTTAVQIASVYQTLANGGVRMPVSLVDGCATADGTATTADRGQAGRLREAASTRRARCSSACTSEGWLADEVEHPRLPGRREDRNRAGSRWRRRLPERATSSRVSGFAPADDPRVRRFGEHHESR